MWRRRYILKFTPLRVLLFVGVIWSHKDISSNITNVQHILLEPSYQEGNSRSTMGPLRAVTEPIKAWNNLHNLIGGYQIISTKVPQSHKACGDLHNLIRCSQVTPLRCLGFQEPNRISGENSNRWNRCNRCNGKNIRNAQILRP
jgi:hypothetical protein